MIFVPWWFTCPHVWRLYPPRPMKTLLTIISASWLAVAAFAQDAAWKFPCPTNEIARHTAHRFAEKLRTDGRLEERAWQSAPTSPRFVDILSGQATPHGTRATVV